MRKGRRNVKNLLKLVLLSTVITASYLTASHFINQKVITVNESEQTLGGLILKGQVQAKLEEAEKKALQQIEDYKQQQREKLEKENEERKDQGLEVKEEEIKEVVIVTEKLEMKEPVKKEDKPSKKPKKDEDKKQEEEQEILDQTAKDETIKDEDSENTTEEEVTQEVCSILPEESVIENRIITDLTNEEYEYFGKFLVDHYFLDGYVYCELESDPDVLTKKLLVRDMEDYMTDSMYAFFEFVGYLTSLDFTQILSFEEELKELKDNFTNEFASVVEYGEEYQAIYEEIQTYFHQYYETVLSITDIIKTSQEGNPFLTITLVLESLETKLIPSIIEVLNTAIDLKENTNAIYLTGVEGVSLLTKEEVMMCIENPGYVLYSYEEINETDTETVNGEG